MKMKMGFSLCMLVIALVLCFSRLGWAKPVPLDIILLEESTNMNVSDTPPFAENCQEFCSYTYPEHTYSEPANFKACTTGCRSAQLDAFIAWPLQTDPEKCRLGCQEMYTTEDRQFSCVTGCRTPTIDSTFPNRNELYTDSNNTEAEIVLSPLDDTLSYFLRTFFTLKESIHFNMLNEHAQDMQLLLVPYLRSDVTVLTNDGVYNYREYSFDNGEPILVRDNNYDSQSLLTDSTNPWNYRYKHRGSSCVWQRLHKMALNKVLLVLSVGLFIAALVACAFTRGENKKGRTKKIPPEIFSFKPVPLSTKKAPYDVGSEFKLPEKQLQPDNTQTHAKVTML